MEELLEKINETFESSIDAAGEEYAVELKILKNNVNTIIRDYMDNTNVEVKETKEEIIETKTDVDNSSDKKRILIVDDSSIIRNYLVKSIDNNYNVSLATGGNEAIGLLENNSYDLILLDLMMPGVDGFAVLDSLKDASNLTPVIIISGDTTKETIDRAFEYNVLDMIEKPFSDKVIMSKINRVLE